MIDLTQHIQRLEQQLGAFEVYEHVVQPTQCEAAIKEVAALQTTLQQIPLSASFLESANQHTSTPAVSIDAMILVSLAREQADKARLSLAAYQPYGLSKARRYLQQRRVLLTEMRALVKTAKEIQRLIMPPYSQPKRPYLHMMKRDDQLNQRERDERCIKNPDH